MAHHKAIRFRSAEKYVARELASAERDAFEAHFFDCPDCAEEVRCELVFAANARAFLRERAAALPKPGLREVALAWLLPRRALAFSLAANAMLASGLGFVLIAVSRDAAAPRLLPAYLAPGPVRGSSEMPVHPIPSAAAAFLAQIRAPGSKYSSYSYEILNAAGTPESAGAVSPPTGQESDLYLEVPLVGLRDGVHTLEVRGNPGHGIISWSKFRISRRKLRRR